jgi:pyrophosphate--fructose-6-phosphate 1-phosphotransferase
LNEEVKRLLTLQAEANKALLDEVQQLKSTVKLLETKSEATVPTTTAAIPASIESPVRRPKKVALLTAGGLAPCLSSCIGALIMRYNELYPDIEIICYVGGYKGLLTGTSFPVTQRTRREAAILHNHGGSPIGNSRVKLTNREDCEKRGYVRPGENPQKVAADQLVRDGVDVLHTIGGDDTNTAAADLAAYLAQNDYQLTVLGLPKTIDNDVYPIQQTLGAWTAAEEGAIFFSNIVYELSCNPNMLIVHEVMGRSCGYLTAATARHYRAQLKAKGFVSGLGMCFEKMDVHAVYIPEVSIDIAEEAVRLKAVMNNVGCVNIFVSEGAGVADIVEEMKKNGEEPPRDAFGHVKLDAVNPGEWFAGQFSKLIGAEKVMVQKSGYYSRSSKANSSDVSLISRLCDLAVDCSIKRISGCLGHDDNSDQKGDPRNKGKLRAIEFERIKGGKPFDTTQIWFKDMMSEVMAPIPPIEGYLAKSMVSLSPAGYLPQLPSGLSLPKRVAIMTAGGLAPCLASAVGGLIDRYNELYPSVEILCYLGGYKGLLLGDSVCVTPEVRAEASLLHLHGGSPIGNSRVKLTNKADCVRRGFCKEDQEPQHVAAEQLKNDGIDVLHTIGGDDTNTAAADLALYLLENQYELTVIGLPKTIDNDVFPLRQTLGAYTAAEQGAKYFSNVVYENSANPRMLIVHEVMGRSCGYLTAATARMYRDMLKTKGVCPEIGLDRGRLDVHAIFIPEMPVNINAEAARLKQIMNDNDCVNLFLSEGAGVEDIIKEKEAKGETLPKDAFGHVKLDAVKPGEWFGKQFAAMMGAEKVLVQKSGYFSRSAPANTEDLRLIKSCTDHAVECALRKEPGVIGHDDERGDVLRAVEFERIKGGKPFDVHQPWFQEMLTEIGQKMHYTGTVRVAHGDVKNVSVRINAYAQVQSAALFS